MKNILIIFCLLSMGIQAVAQDKKKATNGEFWGKSEAESRCQETFWMSFKHNFRVFIVIVFVCPGFVQGHFNAQSCKYSKFNLQAKYRISSGKLIYLLFCINLVFRQYS